MSKYMHIKISGDTRTGKTAIAQQLKTMLIGQGYNVVEHAAEAVPTDKITVVITTHNDTE